MSLTLPTDTLAYHQTRVFTAHRAMGHVSCKHIGPAVNKLISEGGLRTPEGEALWFYAMNHGMALLKERFAPLEPLPPLYEQYVIRYHERMADKAVRAFYYLLMICIRESRHNKSLSADSPKIASLFGKDVVAFLKSGGSEVGIYNIFLNDPPPCTIGKLVDAMRWAFYNCKWSSGYGGKAWGKCNDCLCRFVSGEYSAEMMLDTLWTLCHNNGPIFNKGYLYYCHSEHLVHILDVQRSGQVLALLNDHKHSLTTKFADASLIGVVGALKDMFPDKIAPYCDWYLVEKLGSVHKYPQYKKTQLIAHGESPHMKDVDKAEAEKAKFDIAKQKAALVKAAMDAAAFKEKYFVVMPGMDIEKLSRADLTKVEQVA